MKLRCRGNASSPTNKADVVLSATKEASPLATLGLGFSKCPKSDLAKTFPSLCLPYAPISTIAKLHK